MVNGALFIPLQLLPLRVRMNRGVMAMKDKFIFPKSSESEPHNQMVS